MRPLLDGFARPARLGAPLPTHATTARPAPCPPDPGTGARLRLSSSTAMSDPQIPSPYEDGGHEVTPHDGMRPTIAQRLTASVQTIPRFHLTLGCNSGRPIDAREESNAAAPKDKDGKPAYKLSVNDMVIKALALALQRLPDANVGWTEGGMLKHKHSDVRVAVAMPGRLHPPHRRHARPKPGTAHPTP